MARLHNPARSTTDRESFDLFSAGILFVAIVSIALVLVGVAIDGTSPLFVIPPMILGLWAIASIRRR